MSGWGRPSAISSRSTRRRSCRPSSPERPRAGRAPERRRRGDPAHAVANDVVRTGPRRAMRASTRHGSRFTPGPLGGQRRTVDDRDRERHALHFGLGVARTRAPPVGTVAAGPTTTGVHDLGMFDALSDRLRATLANLTGRGRVSEADVDTAMREVRLALLEADVNFRVVKDFVARVRERAVGAEVLESLTAGQQVVGIVNEELTALLSAGDRTFHLQGNPAVILLVGLQGSGKTTTAAKLARLVVKMGRRPLLVAADPYRPAAADQLETLGRALDLPVHRAPAGTTVIDIAMGGLDAARHLARDVVILDTAGRLSVDQELMDEIAAVNAAVKP